MGRLFSCGIKIIPKLDPSTLRPAGLGSLESLQRCVTLPFFVEPQQPVTSVRAPHSTVSNSSPRALKGTNRDVKSTAGRFNVVSCPCEESCYEAQVINDSVAFTPRRENVDILPPSRNAQHALHTACASIRRNAALQDVPQPLSEICLCLEPDAHEQPPISPPRPSRGVGIAAFRDRHIGHQRLLQHVPGPQRSSASDECTSSDKRVGIRTLYYPHDTHSRIFATEPLAGKIRVRGELAMKLYMRNFSACPEEDSEPIKQKKRHMRPHDHFNMLSSSNSPPEESGTNSAFVQVSNSRTCPTNVNKFQTDFFTWRTPLSRAEPRDRYSIRLVTQPPGSGDLLSWTTPWKHSERPVHRVAACNTHVQDGSDTSECSGVLDRCAGLASSRMPSRIASARKLADYTGNGIFHVPSDVKQPRPDFSLIRKVLAGEEGVPSVHRPGT